jgi:hypothetical protein
MDGLFVGSIANAVAPEGGGSGQDGLRAGEEQGGAITLNGGEDAWHHEVDAWKDAAPVTAGPDPALQSGSWDSDRVELSGSKDSLLCGSDMVNCVQKHSGASRHELIFC